MSDKKISGLLEISSLESNDVILAVDVSDQTMSTSGTNKKITKSNLFVEYETTTQLNARDANNKNRANHTGTQPLSSIIIPDNSISETKLLNYTNSTFTPIFIDSLGNDAPGVVYAQQNGQIFRKDSLLHIAFWISWTSLTLNSDPIYISGMPRALNVNSILRFPLQVSYYNSLNLPANTNLCGFIQDGTSKISLFYSNNITTNNFISANELSTTGEIYGTVLYPNGE